MNFSNPSTVVGGGEMKRVTSSVDIAAHSAGASVARNSRSVTTEPQSVGRPVRQLFATPRHPYTQGLMACLPGKQPPHRGSGPRRLYAIRGQVSSPLSPPPGCAFEPRCDQALAACKTAMPPLEADGVARLTRCVLTRQAGALAA